MKLYDIIVKEKNQQNTLSESENYSASSDEHPVFISDVIPKKTARKKKIIFVSILIILVGLYTLGLWVSYAKITLYERSIPFTLTNTVFTLAHEESVEREAEPYTFQTITTSSTIEREVIGTEFKEVTEYARGLVVFSNEWAKSPETLKVGTIIESPGGKKYKTTASVRVPGYTISGGVKSAGVSTPVPVIALEVGTASNNPGTTFTIPSFSSKKRQQFLAQSVGPLSGGDAGVRHSLSAQEERAVTELLTQQLTERLRRETRAQVPDEFFVSADMQYPYIRPEQFELEGEAIKFTAVARGSLVSYLIKHEVLSALIAQDVLRDQDEGDFYISNLSDLTFTISSPIPLDETIIPDSIQITINGSGVLTSRIQSEEFRKEIAGRSVKEFREYVSNKKTIEKAELSLLPFWSPYLPQTNQLLKVRVR